MENQHLNQDQNEMQNPVPVAFEPIPNETDHSSQTNNPLVDQQALELQPPESNYEVEPVANDAQLVSEPEDPVAKAKAINAIPLFSADPLENYDAYIQKVNQNYQNIIARNSLTTISHLATYTQLYLSDQKEYEIADVEQVINKFIVAIQAHLQAGKAVRLSDLLILDIYNFKDAKGKTVPYVHHPDAKAPVEVISWQSLVNDQDFEIIDTYLKILSDLLAKSYDCQLFANSVLIQNNERRISLYFAASSKTHPNIEEGKHAKKRSKKS